MMWTARWLAPLCAAALLSPLALAHSESVRADVALRPDLGRRDVRVTLTGLASGLRVTGAAVDVRAYRVTPAWTRVLEDAGGALSAVGAALPGTPAADASLFGQNGGAYRATLAVPNGRFVLALVDTTYPRERAVAATVLDLRPNAAATASLVLPKTAAPPSSPALFWLALAVPMLIAAAVALIARRSG